MATSTTVNLRFIESVRDEPKRMLLPISGYEKVIVKSLDDACEAIKHLFDQNFKHYITLAKMNSTAPEDALSPDESASIHLYTLEWDVHENSLYILLNQTLRLADRTKLQPWFKYLKLLLTAFFKLPATEYTHIWRGVREDLHDLYPRGKEFAWWALSSCTASIEVLETPNYLGKSGARTIFSIQTNSGKDIRAHSYFDNEHEVLLPPGLYFRVEGCLNPAEDLYIIQLREIPSPYPLLVEPFDLSQMKKALPTKKENYSTPIVNPKPPVQPVIETHSETKYKPEAAAASVVPKPAKVKSSAITESPTTMMETGKYKAKFEEQGFAVPIKYHKYCKGRVCDNCGKCRDWYYTGDLATWQWIQGCENWPQKDIDRWRNGDYYKGFQKRAGSTCTVGCLCNDNYQS